MKSKKPLIIIAISALLSIATHGYLYSNHLQLKSGVRESTPICHINAKFSCDAAVASQFSEVFGVPIALWGLLANFGLLVLLGMYFLGDRSSKKGFTSVYIAALLISMMSVVMGLISVMFLDSYCPFCLLIYVFSFATIGAAHWYVSGFKNLRFEPGVITQLAAVGIPLLILGFALHFKARGEVRDMEPIIKAAVGRWQATAKVDALKPIEPITLGAPAEKAKMTIVEFADFRCSHCRDAAPVLKAFVSGHSDVRLEFQVYPLDAQCNPQLKQGDGTSCLLATTTFCAQKLSGAGAAVMEYIFANQRDFFTTPAVKDRMSTLAKIANITPEKLAECADGADVKKLIVDQANLGNQVGIQGTPTIFVNGKKLEYGHNLDVLQGVYKAL